MSQTHWRRCAKAAAVRKAASLEAMRQPRRWKGIDIPITKAELREIGGGFQIEGAEDKKIGSVDCDEQEYLVEIFLGAGEAPNIQLARGAVFGTVPDCVPDQPSEKDLAARVGEDRWEFSRR